MTRFVLAFALALTATATASAQDPGPAVPPGYEQQPPPPPTGPGTQQPPQQGYPQQGYPQQGYPQQGYPQQGYPPAAYPAPPPPAEPPEPEPPPSNTVTFNPLALLIGIVNLEYEHAFGSAVSFYVGPQLWLFSPLLLETEADVDVLAVGVNTGVRFFVTGHAPEGFWLGPDLGFAYVEVSDSASSESAVGYSAMGMLGYTWIWGSFVLSIGGGFGYVRAEADGSGYEGTQIGLRASIGFGF